MPARVKVFFDGGCRPNPGRMETAVVVSGRAYVRHDLGIGTSLEAEWLALLEAVKVAQTLGLSDSVFVGDSLAVIGPASGMVKSRGVSVRYFQALMALKQTSGLLRVRYTKRSQNLAGIALACLHA